MPQDISLLQQEGSGQNGSDVLNNFASSADGEIIGDQTLQPDEENGQQQAEETRGLSSTGILEDPEESDAEITANAQKKADDETPPDKGVMHKLLKPASDELTEDYKKGGVGLISEKIAASVAFGGARAAQGALSVGLWIGTMTQELFTGEKDNEYYVNVEKLLSISRDLEEKAAELGIKNYETVTAMTDFTLNVLVGGGGIGAAGKIIIPSLKGYKYFNKARKIGGVARTIAPYTFIESNRYYSNENSGSLGDTLEHLNVTGWWTREEFREIISDTGASPELTKKLEATITATSEAFFFGLMEVAAKLLKNTKMKPELNKVGGEAPAGAINKGAGEGAQKALAGGEAATGKEALTGAEQELLKQSRESVKGLFEVAKIKAKGTPRASKQPTNSVVINTEGSGNTYNINIVNETKKSTAQARNAAAQASKANAKTRRSEKPTGTELLKSEMEQIKTSQEASFAEYNAALARGEKRVPFIKFNTQEIKTLAQYKIKMSGLEKSKLEKAHTESKKFVVKSVKAKVDSMLKVARAKQAKATEKLRQSLKNPELSPSKKTALEVKERNIAAEVAELETYSNVLKQAKLSFTKGESVIVSRVEELKKTLTEKSTQAEVDTVVDAIYIELDNLSALAENSYKKNLLNPGEAPVLVPPEVLPTTPIVVSEKDNSGSSFSNKIDIPKTTEQIEIESQHLQDNLRGIEAAVGDGVTDSLTDGGKISAAYHKSVSETVVNSAESTANIARGREAFEAIQDKINEVGDSRQEFYLKPDGKPYKDVSKDGKNFLLNVLKGRERGMTDAYASLLQTDVELFLSRIGTNGDGMLSDFEPREEIAILYELFHSRRMSASDIDLYSKGVSPYNTGMSDMEQSILYDMFLGESLNVNFKPGDIDGRMIKIETIKNFLHPKPKAGAKTPPSDPSDPSGKGDAPEVKIDTGKIDVTKLLNKKLDLKEVAKHGKKFTEAMSLKDKIKDAQTTAFVTSVLSYSTVVPTTGFALVSLGRNSFRLGMARIRFRNVKGYTEYFAKKRNLGIQMKEMAKAYPELAKNFTTEFARSGASATQQITGEVGALAAAGLNKNHVAIRKILNLEDKAPITEEMVFAARQTVYQRWLTGQKQSVRTSLAYANTANVPAHIDNVFNSVLLMQNANIITHNFVGHLISELQKSGLGADAFLKGVGVQPKNATDDLSREAVLVGQVLDYVKDNLDEILVNERGTVRTKSQGKAEKSGNPQIDNYNSLSELIKRGILDNTAAVPLTGGRAKAVTEGTLKKANALATNAFSFGVTGISNITHNVLPTFFLSVFDKVYINLASNTVDLVPAHTIKRLSQVAIDAGYKKSIKVGLLKERSIDLNNLEKRVPELTGTGPEAIKKADDNLLGLGIISAAVGLTTLGLVQDNNESEDKTIGKKIQGGDDKSITESLLKGNSGPAILFSAVSWLTRATLDMMDAKELQESAYPERAGNPNQTFWIRQARDGLVDFTTELVNLLGANYKLEALKGAVDMVSKSVQGKDGSSVKAVTDLWSTGLSPFGKSLTQVGRIFSLDPTAKTADQSSNDTIDEDRLIRQGHFLRDVVENMQSKFVAKYGFGVYRRDSSGRQIPVNSFGGFKEPSHTEVARSTETVQKLDRVIKAIKKPTNDGLGSIFRAGQGADVNYLHDLQNVDLTAPIKYLPFSDGLLKKIMENKPLPPMLHSNNETILKDRSTVNRTGSYSPTLTLKNIIQQVNGAQGENTVYDSDFGDYTTTIKLGEGMDDLVIVSEEKPANLALLDELERKDSVDLPEGEITVNEALDSWAKHRAYVLESTNKYETDGTLSAKWQESVQLYRDYSDYLTLRAAQIRDGVKARLDYSTKLVYLELVKYHKTQSTGAGSQRDILIQENLK